LAQRLAVALDEARTAEHDANEHARVSTENVARATAQKAQADAEADTASQVLAARRAAREELEQQLRGVEERAAAFTGTDAAARIAERRAADAAKRIAERRAADAQRSAAR
jgi:hypothetical protein